MSDMDGTTYIPEPRTPEEHLNNCIFQLENVRGYMTAEVRDLAAAKATCLLNAAQGLVEAFEQEKQEQQEQPGIPDFESRRRQMTKEIERRLNGWKLGQEVGS